MKLICAVLLLLTVVLPAEAKKTPKSRNAAGYKTHKAPKVKAHRATRVKRRQAN